MGRPRKTAIALGSLEDCNRALAELREANTDIQILDADQKRAVAAASAKYEAELDAAKKTKGELEAALEAYYYAHMAEIEKDGAKFVQLSNGRIGRRDTPPAVKPLNKKWTWEAIGKAVRAWAGERWREFFREPDPVLDEEAIKAAKLVVETLKQLGIKIEGDEKFYAEPAELPGASEVAR